MYTALAGFVEAGETLEECVAREVHEETGVTVDAGSVRYLKSQPWPFPQSSMVAFTATADHTAELNIDTDELVCARWYPREMVAAAATVKDAVMDHDVAKAALDARPDLELLIPPPNVVARDLIDAWLASSSP
uniref:NAD(+) diphosphatase n=1 Tax=Octactis speculum TaxID=3111310 RepID=A0A7S2BT15_9STRA|mmetsp:Transcript_26942/g.37004  ORF Transcript_26942/g.37004 Transcript_26942/m.37004 type:complete len:133 (+) Transcript_26942:307-705(+)